MRRHRPRPLEGQRSFEMARAVVREEKSRSNRIFEKNARSTRTRKSDGVQSCNRADNHEQLCFNGACSCWLA